ncbi:MAG: CoA-binding protein [Candidatus Korarchaeota archaeon]|nr:CoA-binding protein [Candidatus Korarchaeota archaeon]
MRIPKIRDYVIKNLKYIMKPRSIAIIGAAREPGKIGNQVVKNLIDGGFNGKIYPINPKADQILGLKAYPTVKAVPDDVDLAIIVVPARVVKSVIQDCVEKKVKGIVVITSGFSEVGNRELEDEIVSMCRKYKIPLIGPNVVGVLNATQKVNASFGPKLPYKGKIGFVSQSGALVIALIGWTWNQRVGMSTIVSIGNKADVDFSELIVYFAEEDPDTNAVALYIEGLDAGPEFVEACKRASKKIPIVALKAGISERGSLAAMSHTGSMAGSARIYRAVFKQAGVILAENLEDLYDRSLALSLQPPARKDLIMVITNGGGAGVISTDAAEKYGIPLQDTPRDLVPKMKQYMPPFGSAKNPVDLTGMARPEDYYGAVVDALKHPEVGGVVVLYCHTAITNPMDLAKKMYEASKVAENENKPLVVCFIGGEEVDRASIWLKENGVPTYPSPMRAMSAMGALREYGRLLEKL